ncbi:MAG TPA: hypothetical protein VL651_04815 [Bacteroidia bacterium]|jgi:hypothetical protein|nr:hypothetical protein [Bacteroidia bacterium]
MKKSLLYIFAAIALAYGVRALEYMGIRMNTRGQFEKYDRLFLQKNHYDILIIGSSRAESHFRPDIISDSTHLTVYNAGILGATMPFIEGALDAYLEKSDPPKYVILNMDYHMFDAPDDSIPNFPSYFPYLSNHALYEKFSAADPRFAGFKYVPFYSLPYMGSKYLDNALRGFFDRPSKYDTTFHDGYSPIPIPAVGDLDTMSIASTTISLKSTSWKCLENIIGTCKSKNIKLIFVYSPLYFRISKSIVNEKELIAHLDSISTEAGFHSFDYHLSPPCYDKSNFTDLDHLSRHGSWLFSQQFSHDLAQYIRH